MTETGSSFFFLPWVITSEEDSWGVNDACPRRWKNAIRLAHKKFSQPSLVCGNYTPHFRTRIFSPWEVWPLLGSKTQTSIRKSFLLIIFWLVETNLASLCSDCRHKKSLTSLSLSLFSPSTYYNYYHTRFLFGLVIQTINSFVHHGSSFDSFFRYNNVDNTPPPT